jgi:predicted transcriptional regulator
MLSRAFEGSASALVAHLLSSQQLSQDELDEIRRVIDEHHPPSP